MQSLIAPLSPSSAPPGSRPHGLPVAVAVLKQIRELEAVLDRLVASWHASPPLMETRSAHRIQYDRPLILAPMDTRVLPRPGELRIVRGRDVSLGGCSFEHGEPLPCSRVALTFGMDEGQMVTLLIRLSWCRFTQSGVYQSGGRFLKPVAPPFDGPIDWRELPKG